MDIQEVAGSIQLSTGQIAGAEVAVHAMSHSFMTDDTEVVLLVDAVMHLICSITKQLYSTSKVCALPLPLFSSTLTEKKLSFSLMGLHSTVKKGQLRAIL